MKFSTEEIQQEILNWCQYRYQDIVAGIALFDPKPVNEAFPSGDINETNPFPLYSFSVWDFFRGLQRQARFIGGCAKCGGFTNAAYCW